MNIVHVELCKVLFSIDQLLRTNSQLYKIHSWAAYTNEINRNSVWAALITVRPAQNWMTTAGSLAHSTLPPGSRSATVSLPPLPTRAAAHVSSPPDPTPPLPFATPRSATTADDGDRGATSGGEEEEGAAPQGGHAQQGPQAGELRIFVYFFVPSGVWFPPSMVSHGSMQCLS